MEFAVTRFDEIKPNTPITGRRYPACRLVLSPAAAVDLINRMQQVATALTQAGAAKPDVAAGYDIVNRFLDCATCSGDLAADLRAGGGLLMRGNGRGAQSLVQKRDIKVSLCLYCRGRPDLL